MSDIQIVVFHEEDIDEWQVKWLVDGVVEEDKTYYTDDRDDAYATQKYMLLEAAKFVNKEIEWLFDFHYRVTVPCNKLEDQGDALESAYDELREAPPQDFDVSVNIRMVK